MVLNSMYLHCRPRLREACAKNSKNTKMHVGTCHFVQASLRVLRDCRRFHQNRGPPVICNRGSALDRRLNVTAQNPANALSTLDFGVEAKPAREGEASAVITMGRLVSGSALAAGSPHRGSSGEPRSGRTTVRGTGG